MRRFIGGLMAVVEIAFFATTPVVTDVVAKQRYPWNGRVDIDYETTDDTAEMPLGVSVEGVQNGKTYSQTKSLSALHGRARRHHIIWGAGGGNHVANERPFG